MFFWSCLRRQTEVSTTAQGGLLFQQKLYVHIERKSVLCCSAPAVCVVLCAPRAAAASLHAAAHETFGNIECGAPMNNILVYGSMYCYISKRRTAPKFVSKLQCLAEKLAVSLSRIRKAAVVFILDEPQKSLICGLKELEICHNLQH